MPICDPIYNSLYLTLYAWGSVWYVDLRVLGDQVVFQALFGKVQGCTAF